MTKKDFKERCSFHIYSGYRVKHNAIFFDWQETNQGRGFKFGVAVDTKEHKVTKAMLFDELFDWVTGKVTQPSWCIRTKFAATDAERFKTPLSLTF